MLSRNLLQTERLNYKPQLPDMLQNIGELVAYNEKQIEHSFDLTNSLMQLFPKSSELLPLRFKSAKTKNHPIRRVGVVLSGGQAAGGHNVIAGLYDALKKLNLQSRLFGFCSGPIGIIKNDVIEITEEIVNKFRNQGGFDMIGAGRTKIETPDQFLAVEATVKSLDLDGIVIIGGDDSNTNAALLAEYFKNKDHKCVFVGVPKTIDGDLKNDFVEVSFGFDTAAKIYSEVIGNILRDALSAKKYYYFIKLMGRSASHIALECALQTHPNMTLIGEEIEFQNKTLRQLTLEMCAMIVERANHGKNYGVILIPEGVIEFIPEFKELIAELNNLFVPNSPHQAILADLNQHDEKIRYLLKNLSKHSAECFKSIPNGIQTQLLLDRDPHGNVQVSKIETERLFIELVTEELSKRKERKEYKGAFSAQPLFYGYEGRSGLPSNFDCQYCYSLGMVSALLVNANASGYMSCVQNLTAPVSDWKIVGIPLISMMGIEKRHGKQKPVIRKALVALDGKPFLEFEKIRHDWEHSDDYRYPGPIQFFGPAQLTESITKTLVLEQTHNLIGSSI